MLAGPATAGQATFEPEDADEEPDEELPESPLFPPDEPEEPEEPDELEEPEDSEPLLLAEDESPDLDELSEPLRLLSFEPSAAGTVEPLRLSVR
jgi:hypothetical protein